MKVRLGSNPVVNIHESTFNSGHMPPTETHQAIETVFRIEQARLVAGLARIVWDAGLSEELAQDALVTALSEWPKTAANRRAIDRFRGNRMLPRRHVLVVSSEPGNSAVSRHLHA